MIIHVFSLMYSLYIKNLSTNSPLLVLEKQRVIVQKQLENVTNTISNCVLTDSVLDTLRQHETRLNELNEAIN